MTKLKQKIVLFIEKNDVPCLKFSSIGNLYMNRFVIDEDEASEMINIFHLQRENEDQKGMNCDLKNFFKMLKSVNQSIERKGRRGKNDISNESKKKNFI